jgi:hypothetical protein
MHIRSAVTARGNGGRMASVVKPNEYIYPGRRTDTLDSIQQLNCSFGTACLRYATGNREDIFLAYFLILKI